MWLQPSSADCFLTARTSRLQAVFQSCQRGNPYVPHPLQCSQLLYSGLQVIARPLFRVSHSSPCSATTSSSHPLLHGALAVQYVALRALPPELENGVEEDHHAQRQHTGDGDGHGLLRAPRGAPLDHHVHVAVVIVALLRHRGAPVPLVIRRQAVAAHEVPENGPRVAGLHAQQLVVELPVLLPLVKVGEACRERQRGDRTN